MADEELNDIEMALENVMKSRDLKPGDQVAVEGEMFGYKYFHHGIFINHDEGIIDFGGVSMADATVRLVDLFEFNDSGKRRLVKVIYPNGGCLDPDVVVNNAKEFLANPRKWGVYDAIFNNCEHFAMKCKTGFAVSLQVIKKLQDCIMDPEKAEEYVAAACSSSSSGSLGMLGS